MLSALDKDRIAEAVRAAESRTSGEILVVLADEVSHYREIPLAWAALVSLALPPLVLALSIQPLASLVDRMWLTGRAEGLGPALAFALTLYTAAQIVLFIVVLAVAHLPPVRRRLTPTVLKRHRVAAAAHHQFASMSARAIGSETGVLIFVALIDRQVRILADAGIHAKCGEGPWVAAADAVARAMRHGADPTSGLVEAVGICGAALAEHYPPSGEASRPLTDRPLEV